MQRFKRELPTLHRLADQPGGRRKYWALRDMSGEHGKFIYGANGTLTQAARWHIGAIKNTAVRRDMVVENQGLHQNSMLTISIMSLLDSARRGGRRLP